MWAALRNQTFDEAFFPLKEEHAYLSSLGYVQWRIPR